MSEEVYTLVGNALSDGACRSISSSLQAQSSIHTIHLSQSSISPKGAQELASMVAKHPSLTSLDLWQNEVGDEGATALAQALAGDSLQPLPSHNVIRFGHLSDSNRAKQALISPDVLSLLPFSSSSLPSVLKHLDLGSNGIGSVGAKSLAEAVVAHRHLLSLRLADNHVGDEGAIYFAGALDGTSSTPSLTTLDLKNNDISSIGASILARSLQRKSVGNDTSPNSNPNLNPGLRHLDLRENRISNEGALALVDAAACSTSLLSVRLELNKDVSSSALFSLEAALAKSCRARGVEPSLEDDDEYDNWEHTRSRRGTGSSSMDSLFAADGEGGKRGQGRGARTRVAGNHVGDDEFTFTPNGVACCDGATLVDDAVGPFSSLFRVLGLDAVLGVVGRQEEEEGTEEGEEAGQGESKGSSRGRSPTLEDIEFDN